MFVPIRIFLALMFSVCFLLGGCASYSKEPIWDSHPAPRANDGYYEDVPPSNR